jgi:hypothetical protein
MHHALLLTEKGLEKHFISSVLSSIYRPAEKQFARLFQLVLLYKYKYKQVHGKARLVCDLQQNST